MDWIKKNERDVKDLQLQYLDKVKQTSSDRLERKTDRYKQKETGKIEGVRVRETINTNEY